MLNRNVYINGIYLIELAYKTYYKDAELHIMQFCTRFVMKRRIYWKSASFIIRDSAGDSYFTDDGHHRKGLHSIHFVYLNNTISYG